MQTAQKLMVSIPFPSKWGISASIAGRPIIWGVLIINSITGNNKVSGTINFRGTPIQINGYWEENTKQISFDSPYASFFGNLTIFDDPSIRIRHFVLSGRFIMKPPSLLAGEYGTWIATTDTTLTEPPIYQNGVPPAGVFLTSDILY
ncbi:MULTISPECIES: hypothetical protein [Bacillaceae]|uniref:hypothetical protein n=2 Tax=Bacillales TaxID=1385 RepID=UPI000AB690A0|nr:hypothetical protein BACSP_03782 [Bacillus sp. T2.9-1]